MANKKQYWLSLDEKNNESEVNSKEFGTDLPVLNSLSETISTQKSGRRDFLKMLGFGVSAAAVAAACEIPIRKSIPYVVKPEEITPGIPNYYASAYIQGGNYNSFLVKTREGRPILVEGNPDSVVTSGGVNPKSIGSLLNLYDEAGRLRGPMKAGESSNWDTVNSEISLKLAEIAASGKKIALLSSTIISPSTKKVIEHFSNTFTTAEWVEFDANGLVTTKSEYSEGRIQKKVGFEDEKETTEERYEYYENGQLWIRENYKDGQQHGLTELYYENGQLSIKGNFKDGEQHGLLKYFSEDGSLQRSYKYENGEMIID